MNRAETLTLLATTYDEGQLTALLGKVVDVALGQQQERLRRYEQALQAFERQHGMESAAFYEQFEAGKLGDAMDYFEWAGLYELKQEVERKIEQLEHAR